MSLADGPGMAIDTARKVSINLTIAELMRDPWSDGRSASRETQDMLRRQPGPHRPLPAQPFPDAERKPNEWKGSNHESFPTCEDALSVLALAGRLVDGAGYQA